MHADGSCGRRRDLESCGGAGMRLAARAADRKANRGRADGRYRMLSTDSGSRPTAVLHGTPDATAGDRVDRPFTATAHRQGLGRNGRSHVPARAAGSVRWTGHSFTHPCYFSKLDPAPPSTLRSPVHGADGQRRAAMHRLLLAYSPSVVNNCQQIR